MKKLILAIIAVFFVTVFVSANVTIRYYNKDSKTHKMKVKISGSTKTVEFGGSRTTSLTIQGGSDECIIYTSCGEVKVKNGQSIEIKDGCIKIK